VPIKLTRCICSESHQSIRTIFSSR